LVGIAIVIGFKWKQTLCCSQNKLVFYYEKYFDMGVLTKQ